MAIVGEPNDQLKDACYLNWNAYMDAHNPGIF